MLKKLSAVFTFLLLFSFSATLMGNESVKKYFPSTLGSYWVYEDQDGNELTRRAVEGEEIAGKALSAFSYDPKLEDLTKYSPFIQPSLYQVSDAGITLVVGDEIEKTIKSRLSKEIDTLKEIMKRDGNVDDAQSTYNIKVEAHEHSYLLPTSVNLNEGWDVNEIKASLVLDLQGDDEVKVKIDFTIIETGIALDTETVKTAAGTFEDCLKVEYRTETTTVLTPPVSPDDVEPPGETVTAVWFAPNVGIVKFRQETNYIFLDMIPDDADLPVPPAPKPITLELKKYEIKTADFENVEKKSITTSKPPKDETEKEKTTTNNAQNPNYFPSTLGSFWVYEDQDGNELTRRAVEGEEIAGKTLSAFSYDPKLEDLTKYSPFIQPSLYKISDAGITLVVGDEIEKAVKARLKKEINALVQIANAEDTGSSDYDLDVEIKVDAQDHLLFLPDVIAANEEWDANQIEAEVKLSNIDNGVPDDEQFIIDFTIIETATVLGMETVETAASKFEECLKVEYRTDTTVVLNPHEEDLEPPGETVTTVWFAPNVGIVKLHQKKQYIFLEMLPENEGFPMPPAPKPITLELKNYEIKTADFENVEKKSITTSKPPKDETEKEKTTTNNAQNPNYFPSTLGSFWVYEDQDGNELTRRAVEGEEIAGKALSAFSYDPKLEDLTKYSPFIQPSLYQVSDAGITLVVGDEVEKAVKARLKKEIDTFVQLAKIDDPDFDLDVEIKVDVQDHLLFLPDVIAVNEEWDANPIEAEVKLISIDNGVPDDEQFIIDFTIIETGIILGTETVKTPAGTFEGCLKVKYQTESTAEFTPHEEADPPGETVTTLWFAPNVGIVKFHQIRKYTFLELIPDDPDLLIPPAPKPVTLELKKYEIKSANTESSKDNSIPGGKLAEDKVETKKAQPISNEARRSKYFPSALGSYWVYTDQEGNELTRRAVEGEEIAGKTLSAFSYDPELEDWADYSPFIRPSLYQVSDAGITLVVGDEVEKAFKARFEREMEVIRGVISKEAPPDAEIDVDVQVQGQDHLFFLPDAITFNEEWDVNQIKVNVKLGFRGGGIPQNEQLAIDYTIAETGIILGAETVKTAAGTFENCLKVEFRTETTASFTPDPSPGELDPPGETVTTVWFAPDVGIVQYHHKSGHLFLDMIPEDDDFPAEIPPHKEWILELKRYGPKAANVESDDSDGGQIAKQIENESENKYFPNTLGSYWVYTDQDGNELTRRAIEGEEIAGKSFPAFSYEPELEDSADYSRFIRPSLFQVSDTGINFVVGDEVEKAVKARLSKELDIFIDARKSQDSSDENFTYNIEVEAEYLLHLLLTPISFKEEWDVNQVEINFEAVVDDEVLGGVDFSIKETGIVQGTETIETAAGTFEDCLRVEYRTETKAVFNPPEDDVGLPGETVTTVWFAPNVGIVKFHQKSEYMFLDMIPDDVDLPLPPAPAPKTLELKKYEIKTVEPESNDSD